MEIERGRERAPEKERVRESGRERERVRETGKESQGERERVRARERGERSKVFWIKSGKTAVLFLSSSHFVICRVSFVFW